MATIAQGEAKCYITSRFKCRVSYFMYANMRQGNTSNNYYKTSHFVNFSRESTQIYLLPTAYCLVDQYECQKQVLKYSILHFHTSQYYVYEKCSTGSWPALIPHTKVRYITIPQQTNGGIHINASQASYCANFCPNILFWHYHLRNYSNRTVKV